ncbi:MAG: MFS transporter [Myxococcales bacterium]|nr:MFS transporter [Myxococcales bacterium]
MTLARKLSVIAVVYVIEGFPMGVHDLWPVFLRRHGVSRTEIGLLSALSLAWSFKVFWSPLVDRFGEPRRWIGGALVVMVGALLLIAATQPQQHVSIVLWIAMAVYCLGSATQDIAIDAYTIGLIDRGEEGSANGMRMIAYRLGQSGLARGLLFTTRWIGWSGAFGLGALLSLAMSAAARACPPVPTAAEARRALAPAMRRWLARDGVAPVAAFILLYRVGDRAMAPMIQPFWVDAAFSDAEIALVSMLLGIPVALIGALAGASVVTRLGIYRALWLLGALALVSNFSYVLAALPSAPRSAIYAAACVESLCGWLASIAFMSFLMRICEKEHAAVQYALLTALYALTGALIAMPSGWFTDRIGYAGYFALTAAFALPAFAVLPRTRAWIDADA